MLSGVDLPVLLVGTVISQTAGGCDTGGTGGWPTGLAFPLVFDRSFRVENVAGTTYDRWWLWRAVQPPPPADDCSSGTALPCSCCDIYFAVRESGSISGGNDVPGTVFYGLQFSQSVNETPPDFLGAPGDPFTDCPIDGSSTAHMLTVDSFITCETFSDNPNIIPTDRSVTVGNFAHILYLCCPSIGSPTNPNGVFVRVEAA